MLYKNKCREVTYRGKKYTSISGLAKVLEMPYNVVYGYYKRHGNFDGVEQEWGSVEYENKGFLTPDQRLDPMIVKAWLKPCTCGCTRVYIDNLKGWTLKQITCRNCGRYVRSNLIDSAILGWNKEYKEFLNKE